MPGLLPFLISIPHGGEYIPPCVYDRVTLTRGDILEDGDAFAAEIYGLDDVVHTVIRADIARAIVDLNRALTDMPPAHPDGIVKEYTCYRKPVYDEGRFPTPDLIDQLIREHYRPYHDQIRTAVRRDDILLALDCHSMAAQAPPIEANAGASRPLICISNAHGRSCDTRYAEVLAACFREVFELQPNQVTLNDPFAGGFITRTYGGHPIPWIQIEVNRSLYLTPPWFNPSTLTISLERLTDLRARVTQTLTQFRSRMSKQRYPQD